MGNLIQAIRYNENPLVVRALAAYLVGWIKQDTIRGTPTTINTIDTALRNWASDMEDVINNTN